MANAELMLDPNIRDWVLLPIVAVMIMVGIGRSMVQVLLKADTVADLSITKHQMLLTRSNKLRMNGGILPPRSFQMRKDYMIAKGSGRLREKMKGGAPNPMADPSTMINMMKQNMSMMLPNVVMMGWISYFFSGFVLAKVPFMLTERFKSMLQRGVELQSLDVSYVSSLSWYFLVMFGLRGLFTLILGGASVDSDAQMMQAQMGMGGMGMGAKQNAFDPKKAYKQERESLKLAQHEWTVGASERKLVGMAPVPESLIAPAAAGTTAASSSSGGMRQRKSKR